jgi:hypothetical protein
MLFLRPPVVLRSGIGELAIRLYLAGEIGGRGVHRRDAENAEKTLRRESLRGGKMAGWMGKGLFPQYP